MIARRLWGIAVVLGLFVLVASASWACLYASIDQATASTSVVVAIGSAIVVVVGILARGQGVAAVTKVRQVVGAIGLLITPVAAVLTLLAFADPPMIPVFLLVTVLALVAWMQWVTLQSGLSLGVVIQWFITLVLFAVVALTVSGLLVGALVGVLGWDSPPGTQIELGLVVAMIAVVLVAWARGRRDRQALGRAIGRTAFGRARTGDTALLAAGPGPILRGRPLQELESAERDPRRADWETRLAAGDARLAPPSPDDRDPSAGDR